MQAWIRGVLLVGALGPALAQGAVYRCLIDGDVVYQDTPCPGEGEKLELNIDRPTPEELERARERREAMRRVIEEAEAARARQRAQAARATAEGIAELRAETLKELADGEEEAVDVILGAPFDGLEVIRRKRDEDNRRSTPICPLGLANCKKVADRVFRRPKATPELPVGPVPDDDSSRGRSSRDDSPGRLEPRDRTGRFRLPGLDD